MTTFVDALQRPVEVKERPRRIVSLVPSLTEALFKFGIGEQVVGVTNFCVEPKERVAAKAKVGGTKTLDVARVKALAPDLIIANAEENRQEDIQQLVRAGLAVFVTFPRSVAGAIEMMSQLAEITGAQQAAQPLIEAAQAALDEARTANDGRQPVRVFCPIWRSPWMTIGPDAYTHDFIAVCGGANIFADRWERYPRVELDEVARRNPEVILLPDEPYRFGPKHLAEFARFPQVSAVRDKRIYLLEGKHLCWYGPRIAASLPFVQRLLWERPGS